MVKLSLKNVQKMVKNRQNMVTKWSKGLNFHRNAELHISNWVQKTSEGS